MKKRIFSGIQPSGNLHLGNYLGAIKNWVRLQDEYDSIFCVVDLHAITVPQDPEKLRQQTLEVAKVYLASGIDPEKCSIFIQSQVSEHAELAWILNTISKVSELKRMTQFKDKTGLSGANEIKTIIQETYLKDREDHNKIIKGSQDNWLKIKSAKNIPEKIFKEHIETLNRIINHIHESPDSITKFSDKINFIVEKIENISGSVGLFDYPILMAADILLYNTNLVPVGEDQLQHIELTRTLANRFNKKFGDTFVVPEAHVQKEGMRIMGLDDPTKKMSKSASSEYNYIALTDDEETVRRKIKKAVTDSGSEIVYAEDKPALMNLIHIYSLLSGLEAKEIEEKFKGKGYADFKEDLADVVINFLKPLQEKIAGYSDEEVLEILRHGADKVRPIAKKKLDEVKQKIGFII